MTAQRGDFGCPPGAAGSCTCGWPMQQAKSCPAHDPATCPFRCGDDGPPAAAVPRAETGDKLRDALRVHHPIMRSETGPFSGCRCGRVRLGQDVIAHVVDHLRRALAGHDKRAAADGHEWVQLPTEDVAFLRGFHPDRDRTATRADMVRVIEHLQVALAQLSPQAET